jgi:carboxylesterase type B
LRPWSSSPRRSSSIGVIAPTARRERSLRLLLPPSASPACKRLFARALARDAACVAPDCSTPPTVAARAARLASVVKPLDDAYGRERTQSAKLRRVPTSAFLHAAQELASCFHLSARQGGTST